MFLWVKMEPGGAVNIVLSDTRESLSVGDDRCEAKKKKKESRRSAIGTTRSDRQGGDHEPASQEQETWELSLGCQILQQVRVGGISDRRTEVLISLVQRPKLREPRSRIVQRGRKNGEVVDAFGKDLDGGDGLNLWGRDGEGGEDGRRDDQQNWDEELRKHDYCDGVGLQAS